MEHKDRERKKTNHSKSRKCYVDVISCGEKKINWGEIGNYFAKKINYENKWDTKQSNYGKWQ